MLNNDRAGFLHPLASVEASGDPEILMFNAFALAEDMVMAALSPECPEQNWRVVQILHDTHLPAAHIGELFDDIRAGNRHALLRLIEYVADALIDECEEPISESLEPEAA